jgi:hypothetical protein
MAVGGTHYLLIIEGKPEAAAAKPIPLRDVNQVGGQPTRFKSRPDYQKHVIAALFVSARPLVPPM